MTLGLFLRQLVRSCRRWQLLVCDLDLRDWSPSRHAPEAYGTTSNPNRPHDQNNHVPLVYKDRARILKRAQIKVYELSFAGEYFIWFDSDVAFADPSLVPFQSRACRAFACLWLGQFPLWSSVASSTWRCKQRCNPFDHGLRSTY